MLRCLLDWLPASCLPAAPVVLVRRDWGFPAVTVAVTSDEDLTASPTGAHTRVRKGDRCDSRDGELTVSGRDGVVVGAARIRVAAAGQASACTALPDGGVGLRR